MEATKAQLEEMLCELEEMLLLMEEKLGRKGEKVGRKDELLGLLKGGGLWSIKELSVRMGISDRNVSSLLSYLRKDGYEFGRFGSGSGKIKLMK